jgi:CubicO group peptidase (beta-lactamase class C family)
MTAILSLAVLVTPSREAQAQAPSAAQFERAVAYASRTDGQALLVMHRGRIIHERYLGDGSASKSMMLASGSKSFVGVGTIAAVADGLLRLDQPVAELLTEWKSDPRKSRVTVRQLLSLESGIETGNPGTGCGGPRSSWADAIAAPALVEPGTRFRYGPYPFITMGAAIERVNPRESFDAYLERRVLAPLGVTVNWRMQCSDGKPQLAGGAAMTARDWATFGEMIRRGGMHGTTRILPAELVAQLFRPSSVNPAYGMSWWLRDAAFQTNPAMGAPGVGAGDDDTASGSARPGGARGRVLERLRQRAAARRGGEASSPAAGADWLPQDLVMAAGAGKQRLYLIPSQELVIVRMGPVRGGRAFRDDEFLGALLR